MTDYFDFDQVINRDGTASLKYDARQALFGRADILPMWVADMDFATPPAITRALQARANSPIYGYTDLPESLYQSLIDWLARRHGWAIKREWIMFCPGVVPSIHAAVMAFTQRGESVIVQPPVYFPFFSAVKITGRVLIENTLILNNQHYQMDVDHLRDSAKVANLLLLCSPHNPVGRVWQTDELNQLLSIAHAENLVIFSDEIHADIVYPNVKHRPIATLTPNNDNIITAIAPSKTFNIAGLNLSTLIVPNAKHRTALQTAFNTMQISVANPFSIVAFEAAYKQGEPWLKEMLDYLKKNYDFVADFLHAHLPEIQLIPAQGTYLIWLDCRALRLTDEQLQHFFIFQAGLGLSAGTLFGKSGSGFMRMNIACPKKIIAQALANIVNALKK